MIRLGDAGRQNSAQTCALLYDFRELPQSPAERRARCTNHNRVSRYARQLLEYGIPRVIKYSVAVSPIESGTRTDCSIGWRAEQKGERLSLCQEVVDVFKTINGRTQRTQNSF